jgi:hypothetical protein
LVSDVKGGMWIEEENCIMKSFITKVIKLRRMRWAENVAHMGRKGMLMRFLWETKKEGDD